MNSIAEKWNKISNKGKKHHIFLRASLYRYIPLVFVLLIMAELNNKYRYVSIKYLIVNFVIKMVIAYIIGVYIGNLEWKDLERMSKNDFKSDKLSRRTYIYRYGFCMFGTSMALANVNLFFVGIWNNLFIGTVYLISGLLWGVIMSSMFNKINVN